MFNNLSAVFFAEEMGMTLVNSAELELNETQGYTISRYKVFTISLVTPNTKMWRRLRNAKGISMCEQKSCFMDEDDKHSLV